MGCGKRERKREKWVAETLTLQSQKNLTTYEDFSFNSYSTLNLQFLISKKVILDIYKRSYEVPGT